MNPHRSFLRGLRRAAGILIACTAGFGRYVTDIVFKGRTRDQLELARWTQGLAKDFLKILDIDVRVRGTTPASGMLACNHLSYLDIVVLAALSPTTFVSKYQVKHWPIFGWLGVMSGTHFLRRERKSHALEISRRFGGVIESGAILTLFPEGTSTDGTHVKPFHSTLFQPATEHAWPVTPGWITYDVRSGSVAREICFIDDMLFLPHFLNLLCRDGATATVVYGERLSGELNRKEIAAGLHRQVCRLAAENSGCEHRSNPQVEWSDTALDHAAVSLG